MTNKERLIESGSFFHDEDGLKWDYPGQIAINLNDTFGWACADCEVVPEDEINEVYRLYCNYGHCGLLYWVSKKRGGQRSEFKDINRYIDFVDQEERLIAHEPDFNKRAYMEWP